jgi:hypothetical protein
MLVMIKWIPADAQEKQYMSVIIKRQFYKEYEKALYLTSNERGDA